MTVVGIRELKARLSEYLSKVRTGENILVTDRGRVVAELRPPGPTSWEAEVGPGLAALASRGSLRLGAPNEPSLYPELAPLLPAGASAQLLDEERGER